MKTSNPLILDFYKKKNLRSLSSDEAKNLEYIKTQVLFSIQPYSAIENEKIASDLSEVVEDHTKKAILGYEYWVKVIASDLNRILTTEEQKLVKSIYYSSIHTQEG